MQLQQEVDAPLLDKQLGSVNICKQRLQHAGAVAYQLWQ